MGDCVCQELENKLETTLPSAAIHMLITMPIIRVGCAQKNRSSYCYIDWVKNLKQKKSQ
jgi:hypothetical protein